MSRKIFPCAFLDIATIYVTILDNIALTITYVNTNELTAWQFDLKTLIELFYKNDKIISTVDGYINSFLKIIIKYKDVIYISLIYVNKNRRTVAF